MVQNKEVLQKKKQIKWHFSAISLCVLSKFLSSVGFNINNLKVENYQKWENYWATSSCNHEGLIFTPIFLKLIMVHGRNMKLAFYTFLTINDTEDIFPGEILQKIETALIQPIANVRRFPQLFCQFSSHLSFAFFLFSFPQQEPPSLLLQLHSLLNQHSLFHAGNWSWSRSWARRWSWSSSQADIRSWSSFQARIWSQSCSRFCQKTSRTFFAIFIYFLQKKTSWSCAWSYWSFQSVPVIPWSKVS